MHKKLKNFHKRFASLKSVVPWTGANKSLKEKILDDAEDLFNNLYYICKDKYNEEINNLNKKDGKNFTYKTLRLTDDYLCPSEEEQQTSKEFKKKTPKKRTQTDIDEFIEFIIKEETGINKELFKNYFNFQMPTALLKLLYNLDDKEKNKQLVDVIESGLIDLKNKIKKMSEDGIKNEKPH